MLIERVFRTIGFVAIGGHTSILSSNLIFFLANSFFFRLIFHVEIFGIQLAILFIIPLVNPDRPTVTHFFPSIEELYFLGKCNSITGINIFRCIHGWRFSFEILLFILHLKKWFIASNPCLLKPLSVADYFGGWIFSGNSFLNHQI